MVLVQVLLPAAPAGAAPVDAALAETGRELAARFGGLTAYIRSPAQGVWTAPDGHREQDTVVMVEVVTEVFDRAWWREYARTLAERFAQDAIHIRALPVQMLDDDAS